MIVSAWVDTASKIAPVAAVAVALVALVLSWRSNASVVRSQIYLELRKRFREIDQKLQQLDYKNLSWRPELKSKEYLLLQCYWFQTFDEWFTTKVLHPWLFGVLWSRFFEKATFEGMKHRSFRFVLHQMLEGDSKFGVKPSSFSGLGQEFHKDLEAIWEKHRKKRIQVLIKLKAKEPIPCYLHDKLFEFPIIEEKSGLVVAERRVSGDSTPDSTGTGLIDSKPSG